MWLLAGLGNFGENYAKTRHNAGFMALDAISQKHNLQNIGKKFHSIVCKGNIAGENVIGIYPQTFMNKSGLAVIDAANFYKIPPQNIIAIHDDLDLDTGRLKVKLGGGNGGHNGLKDIDRVIGNNYWRLRIGINRPTHSSAVSSYVLQPFTTDEQITIDSSCDFIANNIHLLLSEKEQLFMNNFALIP
jgi:PTH1 family peptidyl-tRNA hydrolase